MLVFAIRRLLQAIPVLFGVSLVVFGLVHIVPGNPIDMLMPPEASPEVIAQMKAAFAFDKPLYMQYLLWLLRALHGAFGLPVFNATPIWGQLVVALKNTLVLAIPAAVLGFSLGILFGMLSAMYYGRWPDKLFSSIATIGVSLSHYWCAIVLVVFCAVLHEWLPAQGMCEGANGIAARLRRDIGRGLAERRGDPRAAGRCAGQAARGRSVDDLSGADSGTRSRLYDWRTDRRNHCAARRLRQRDRDEARAGVAGTGQDPLTGTAAEECSA